MLAKFISCWILFFSVVSFHCLFDCLRIGLTLLAKHFHAEAMEDEYRDLFWRYELAMDVVTAACDVKKWADAPALASFSVGRMFAL